MTVARSEVPEDIAPERMMTIRQKTYLLDLIQKREMTEKARREATVKIANEELTMKEASAWIERAQLLPHRVSEFVERKSEMPNVPAGRYALGDDDDPENPVRFYEVSIGAADNPRWAGFVFLDVFASDEKHPIKDFAKKQSIMTLIAADPVAASTRYGLLTCRCGVCHRKLTKKESRERGIGPKCAERMGW